MKFKSFNPESIPQNARAGIPKIALNSKSGTLSFTKSAVERLGLTEKSAGGVKIEFFFEEEKEEWYLAETKSGFDIRSKTDQTMIFNSTFLVKKIFDSMAYEKHTGHILIGSEPEMINKVKYWPLITSTLKND